MDILRRVKIIDREAGGYCKVGHVDDVSKGVFKIRVENQQPKDGEPRFTYYEGLRRDQIRDTYEGLAVEMPVGMAQLLDVIHETHGYDVMQCRSILDYALRSEAVIELLLKTIAEDDDISRGMLAKRTIELQTRDEDYYGKKYAHLRKTDEQETVISLLRDIQDKMLTKEDLRHYDR
jgi:hypothetical protein